jgi:pyruvoyl-dependent arginine decarboxylase (PvlArgDC)
VESDLIVELAQLGLVLETVQSHLQTGHEGSIEALALGVGINHDGPHAAGVELSILHSYVEDYHVGLELLIVAHQLI